MTRLKIKQLLSSNTPEDNVLIKGWVKTRRDSKDFSFLEINDGSCLKNIQVIADTSLNNYEKIKTLSTGSAVSVTGKLVKSPGGKQNWEIQTDSLEIISLASESYPLQKKRHSDEFLRTIAHLRPRTNKYGSAFRIRSELSYAIHKFFKEKDFKYIHTPIITGSDCEGAGELFRITALDLENLPTKNGKIDYLCDFFGKEANLTVSGQLSAEMFALSLGDVYTFGPTFRAENSNIFAILLAIWILPKRL